MNQIYEFSIQQLKNYSKSFKTKNLFLNKPWTLIDEDQEIQRIIFKKNGELIISKNGEVLKGQWEYLPEAKSLLITRGNNTILCNEGFLNEGILIFKKDGTENQFFVLANENEVPDLDTSKYLTNLRYSTLGISFGYLQDGRIMEVERIENLGISVGSKVNIDYQPAEDGVYATTKSSKKYEVINSVIARILHLNEYNTKAEQVVLVEQKDQFSIHKGDKVFIGGEIASDGKYKLIGESNIHVRDGIVIKKSWF